MDLWLVLLLALVVLLGVGDVAYRIFIIHPRTDASGRYAAIIEGDHIHRWQTPVLAGHAGPIDVYIAGNSHVMDGVDPRVIAQITGYRAYNLALYSLPAQHAVRLLLKYGRYPRLILIDFSTRYSTYLPSADVEELADRALNMSAWQRRLYDAADRVQWLAPSLFVPRRYRPLMLRIAQRLLRTVRSGRFTVSRYTPFRLVNSYDWWLDKSTNHRVARRARPQSRSEARYEEHLMQKTLAETARYCDPGSPAYRESMRETERQIRTLLQHDVGVVLMRMPLHPMVVRYEDEHCGCFFRDLEGLANSLGLEYLDLTSPAHLECIGELEFYGDGQHIIYPGDEKLSRYLGAFLTRKLKAPASVGILR